MAIPRLYVNPPSKKPLPFNILTAVDFTTPRDPHWVAGVEWQSLCGGAETTIEYCVTGGSIPSKADTGGTETRGASAFTVYAEVDCAAPGGGWERNESDARELLEISEPYAVERAFWTGAAAGIAGAVYPRLAADTAQYSADAGTPGRVLLQTAATIVTGGTGVTPEVGLGALEAAAATCNKGASVIHVPLIAVPALMRSTLIRQDGNKLVTTIGNVVIPGSGYTNTSPAGVAAGPSQAWLYATGPLFGYRGSVRTFQRETTLDRSTNTVKAIAERTYVLGFECCHYAVLINL